MTSHTDLIFSAAPTEMKDERLKNLMRAKEVWITSALADRRERMLMAHELHAFEMFSLNQLAKICRLTVPTVSRHMKKNAVGGKFQPEVLNSLIYLRRLVIINSHIPASFVKGAVETGTSVGVVARLTGASESSLYFKTKQ